jgi:hypothetical protein
MSSTPFELVGRARSAFDVMVGSSDIVIVVIIMIIIINCYATIITQWCNGKTVPVLN